MRLRWGFFLAMLAAPALGASTIDVSSETATTVHTGDTLAFQLLTWSYGINATAFGLSPYPTAVSFELITAPQNGTSWFSGILESADGSVTAAFDSLSYGTGYLQSAGYTGQVSTIQGSLQLSAALAQALFGSGSAVIALRNEGPDVTLGLAPYVLRQDMYTSLSGGPLSVGAVPGQVNLELKEGQGMSVGLGAVQLGYSSVPEPASGRLFLGGGALLCALSLVLARFSPGRA